MLYDIVKFLVQTCHIYLYACCTEEAFLQDIITIPKRTFQNIHEKCLHIVNFDYVSILILDCVNTQDRSEFKYHAYIY